LGIWLIKDDKISIISNGYEFDSIDELKEKSKSVIQNLHIKSYKSGYIDLEIKKSSVHLYSSNGNDVVAGVWHILVNILRKHEILFYKILNPFIFYFPFALSIGPLLGAGFASIFSPSGPVINTIYIVLAISTFVLLLLSLTRYLFGSKLILIPKNKHEGFWKLNKDKILLAIIGIIIGSLGKFLYDILFLPKS
jgi:hypothetical protein